MMSKTGKGNHGCDPNAILDESAGIGYEYVIMPDGKNRELRHDLYCTIVIIPKDGAVPSGTVS